MTSFSNQPAPGTDLVLEEMWRIKDERSAARNHDVHRLSAEARERQKLLGRRVVTLDAKHRAAHVSNRRESET